MPTKLSNCDECNYLKEFNIDHILNQTYKKHLQIKNILTLKINNQSICERIVFYSNYYSVCNHCNLTKLCYQHTQRAINNGKYYHLHGILCDTCCWWGIV